MASYICSSKDFDSIWKILFRKTEPLDTWSKCGMKFLILGTNLQFVIDPNDIFCTPLEGDDPVLAIANLCTGKFTTAGWDIFRDCLHPHSYNEENYEIQFTSLNVKLNVYNLYHKTLSHGKIAIKKPQRLFHDKFDSGDVYTISTSVTVYGGGIEEWDEDNFGSEIPGPISQHGIDYRIKLKHSGQSYKLDITNKIVTFL
jgi:hypothetical protein